MTRQGWDRLRLYRDWSGTKPDAPHCSVFPIADLRTMIDAMEAGEQHAS
jgi:hypothetical protein